MKNLLKIFNKEKPQHRVPEYIVFSVDNFNNWFNAPDNNAVYANTGIFLRLSKLSISHVTDYILKAYGIENYCSDVELYTFYNKIQQNWIDQNRTNDFLPPIVKTK